MTALDDDVRYDLLGHAGALFDLLQRPAWHAKARCRGYGPAAFFGTFTERRSDPMATCRRCGVRSACLATALADPSLLGVWGATTERERRVMRRASA